MTEKPIAEFTDEELAQYREELAADAADMHRSRQLFHRLDQCVCDATSYLVDPIVETNSMAMIYGPSGEGKTFISLTFACCVSTGHPFFGLPVMTACSVLYCCGEGGRGVRHRAEAWRLRHGYDPSDMSLYLSTSPILFGGDSVMTQEVVDLGHHINEVDRQVGLIVVDTVARSLLGDENKAPDMGSFIRDMDWVRGELGGATVLMVHHCGWANQGRARGHSSLHAALDMEYSVTKDASGQILLQNSKTRNATPAAPMAFQIENERISLANDDEEDVGVLVSTDYVEPETPRPLGKNEALAREVLWKLEPDHPGGVPVDEWSAACRDAGLIKQRFNETKRALLRKKRISILGGRVTWGNEPGHGNGNGGIEYPPLPTVTAPIDQPLPTVTQTVTKPLPEPLPADEQEIF